MFCCGDDADAKAQAAQLITDIGLEPVAAVPLKNARFVKNARFAEPTAMLVLQLGAFLGRAKEWSPGEFTDLFLKLIRR